MDVDEEDLMNGPVPESEPADDGSGLDPESEHEEEELDAAFEREESASSYDSEASNERFEQQLLDAEGSESDISEFEGPSKKSKKQSKAYKGQKSKEKAGFSRRKHAKSGGKGSISQDEEWEEADVNEDLEFGDDQDDDQANEAGRSNIFEQVNFNHDIIDNIAQEAGGGTPGRTITARDQALLDPLQSIRDDLRAAKGFKKKGRGRGKGARYKKLSPELQELSNVSAISFVNGDMDAAFRYASEMIRIDAEIPQAWSCLAGVHESRGDYEKGIGCRLMHAQLSKDGMIWNEVREHAHERGKYDVAKYAQKRALSTDSWNPEVLLQSGIYFTEMQDDKMALKCFRRLFKVKPYDIRALKQCVYIYGSGSVEVDIWEGVHYLVNAFEYHTKTFPTPYEDNHEEVFNEMDREYLQLVIDLLILARDYDLAATVLKRGERWLQSRSKQVFWDRLENDSEYDPPGAARAEEDTVTEDREGYDLDLSMRARLAVIRLKLGQDEDADIHVRMICESSPADYAPFWVDVAKTLMGRVRYLEALNMLQAAYEAIPNPEPPVDQTDEVAMQAYKEEKDALTDCLINIGVCNQRLIQYDQAVEIFRTVISDNPEDHETKSKLAAVLEDRGGPGDLKQALALIKEVRKSRQDNPQAEQADNNATTDEGGFFNPTQVSYNQLRARARLDKVEASAQLEIHTKMLMERMGQVEGRAFAMDPIATQSYISDARQMVTEFRQARVLFPKERGIKFMVASQVVKLDLSDYHGTSGADEQRLEDKIVDEDEESAPVAQSDDQLIQKVRSRFLGLSADQWLDVTIKLSSLLLRDRKEIEVMQMCQHMSHSVIFQPEKYKVKLHLVVISGAIRAGDLSVVLDEVRFFTNYYQYRVEPWRLISALGSGSQAADRFTNTIWQKYMLRQLRLWNGAAAGNQVFWHDPTGRWVLPQTEKQKLGIHPVHKIRGDRLVALGENHRKKRDFEAEPDADVSEDSEHEEEILDETVMTKQALRAILFPGYRPQKPPLPKKNAIGIEFVYGQTLASARSWQGAIAYYLRVYRVDPYNSLLCLSLAHAYMARSLQRQCDNKMHMVTLGATFLNRYRALRKNEGGQDLLVEIEYNFGRAFHGLGVLNLAVKHYRQALVEAEALMKAASDPQALREKSVVKETAYNLMSIFLLTGSTLLAKNVSDKWLAI